MLSEHSLEKHGWPSYEDSNSGTKLDNFVPQWEKGGTAMLCDESDLFGKKTEDAEISLVEGNFLCMKTWVSQPKDMEVVMRQEEISEERFW
jgi:hypothetical protein